MAIWDHSCDLGVGGESA